MSLLRVVVNHNNPMLKQTQGENMVPIEMIMRVSFLDKMIKAIP